MAQFYLSRNPYRLVPVQITSGDLRRIGTPTNVAIGCPFDYNSITSISYSNHIQVIFTSSCAVHACHVGSDDTGEDKRSGLNKSLHGGQFSLKSWDDVMKGGPNGAVAIPFRASKSHLIYHVNTDTLLAPVSVPHMPLDGFDLPRDQVLKLIRWVNEGAPNDFGAVAYSVHPKGKVLVTNQSEDLIAVIDIQASIVARYIQAGVPDVFTQPPHAPHSIAVDRQRNYYYTCLIGAGKVLKFRASDNVLVGEISGILSPSELALTVSGDTAYVAQFADNSNAIRRINTRTMEFLGSPITHPSLRKAHGMHLSHDGRYSILQLMLRRMRKFCLEDEWSW